MYAFRKKSESTPRRHDVPSKALVTKSQILTFNSQRMTDQTTPKATAQIKTTKAVSLNI